MANIKERFYQRVLFDIIDYMYESHSPYELVALLKRWGYNYSDMIHLGFNEALVQEVFINENKNEGENQ